MLECFQRQQSLFSYAINCLNRLPVEFLMCYKFHVCFPWVDSTQAYCVRPCPVISTGLGRTSTKENPSTYSPLQLNAIIGLLCTSLPLMSLLSQCNLSITSASYVNGLLLCIGDFFVLIFPIQEVGVKAGEGHWAMSNECQKIILQHSEELDSSDGTSLVFVSSKCRISHHSRAFTCRSQTLLPIHFNA